VSPKPGLSLGHRVNAGNPSVRKGSFSTGPYTHYSLLRTLENGFNLGYLGNAA